MLIKFFEDGDSPDIGVFLKDYKRIVPESLGRIFIERGLAEEIKPKKEMKENGGK